MLGTQQVGSGTLGAARTLVKISADIESEQKRALDARAHSAGRSRSAELRRAIDNHLLHPDDVWQRVRSGSVEE